jgi:hypothetical protein
MLTRSFVNSKQGDCCPAFVKLKKCSFFLKGKVKELLALPEHAIEFDSLGHSQLFFNNKT